MKKRIICGSAAILLTGLTSAMFTIAAPHVREDAPAATVTSLIVETVVVECSRHVVENARCKVNGNDE